MTKIDIYSGFLGAGKTTLIKHMISHVYTGEKLVLIENEFGEIGIDGGFLQDSGIQITEMNSGCICCSLVGDFSKALSRVIEQYHPDRIIIEPSGVGKLSDVTAAVAHAELADAQICGIVTVVDAKKCKMYMKNFGEFFDDQISSAHTVIMSHTDTASPERIEEALRLIREKNPRAVIVTTPVSQLEPKQLSESVYAFKNGDALMDELMREAKKNAAHHHHDDDEDECEHHHHHHDDDEDECEHHHHHHDDDEENECEHHHHHDHGADCKCGCHDGHHHHHDADEVFVSWGRETTRAYTEQELEAILSAFDSDTEHCGIILRSKGIVPCRDGGWLHFDYIPADHNIRHGSAAPIGKLCVIGSEIKEEHLAELFGIS